MTFTELDVRLREALAGPLPGLTAQVRMAPEPRPGWLPGYSPEESRGAAALLLLFPVGDTPQMLLTVRASHLPKHAGQVSLPGGAVEANETIEQAALREAHEEVGLDADEVRVLGRLTPLHIPVSGFMLHPVVGLSVRRPDLRPADGEVERVLEVPLPVLADPSTRRERPRTRLDGLFQFQRVPYYDVCGFQVWGATAMVLAEFLALLERDV